MYSESSFFYEVGILFQIINVGSFFQLVLNLSIIDSGSDGFADGKSVWTTYKHIHNRA